jgi:hypothetical protein
MESDDQKFNLVSLVSSRSAKSFQIRESYSDYEQESACDKSNTYHNVTIYVEVGIVLWLRQNPISSEKSLFWIRIGL